jgi:hypothetical protein
LARARTPLCERSAHAADQCQIDVETEPAFLLKKNGTARFFERRRTYEPGCIGRS